MNPGDNPRNRGAPVALDSEMALFWAILVLHWELHWELHWVHCRRCLWDLPPPPPQNVVIAWSDDEDDNEEEEEVEVVVDAPVTAQQLVPLCWLRSCESRMVRAGASELLTR
jgi:hypothetical protein